MSMKYASIFALLFLVGCTTLLSENLFAVFGRPDATRFDQHEDVPYAISYNKEVRPILERRCVVCHSCYDAPCQLKLGSYEGIIRGASKDLVYQGTRLFETEPTRLFIDADKPSVW
ncbi:MAG: hypothetical protein ACI93R_003218 [Flavobacteriales bacterium]|jgi:hypothetical protein